ncbi:MAG TPA: ChbG/HpnK family deacetylase, partial [Burkholderiaceae bacterium]|nr:ChbG/HpnK family deacetylase [Burkholderiaceae bacterium]
MHRGGSAAYPHEAADAPGGPAQTERIAAGHRSGVPARTICIAADDFGLHGGINAAVLHLAAMGRVQAIGCMVGAPAWAAGAPNLRALDPHRVDLGLHLDLCEHPMRPPGRRLDTLLAAGLLRQLDRHALRAEIRAQLDTFEQTLGRPPAFIDGHRHVHQLPGVREELLDELAQRRGPLQPWLRCTRRP